MREYEIDFVKLKNGHHDYSYKLDAPFFELFDTSLISNGEVQVEVGLEKIDNLMEFNISHNGTIHLACDRCLDQLDYPVKGEQLIVVKIGQEEADDENVLHVSSEAHSVNLGQVIYELVCTSLPLVRYCEDAGKECNEDMLEQLNGSPSEEPDTDPRWDKLKDLYK